MIQFKSYVQFYYSAAWHTCLDVLADYPLRWEYGFAGSGAMDLVATTGLLLATLDNSIHNAAGEAGYYSPGGAEAPAWFTDGLPVRVLVERQDNMASAVKFLGEVTHIRPTAGRFDEAITEIEAQDWMGYASAQTVGQLAIATNKRADEALTLALAEFPRQPEDTDFEVGIQTFPLVFDSDEGAAYSMAALLQKLAVNEGGGYIFLTGDGTLTFHNRHHRPLASDADLVLDPDDDSPVSILEVAWSRASVANRIEMQIYPAQVDALATTVLWALQQPMAIPAGEEIVVKCAYRDPDTGAKISATSIVDPLVSATHIKFGSQDDMASNDLIADLTFPLSVGGNAAEVTLTNTGDQAGFLNKLEIVGKGIYNYDPVSVIRQDATSISARGEQSLQIQLRQSDDAIMARGFAVSLLQELKDMALEVELIRFPANLTADLAAAALALEPNQRVTVVELQTATSQDYFTARLRFEQAGPLLWIELIPSSFRCGNINYFIWDLADHGWDEGRWVF